MTGIFLGVFNVYGSSTYQILKDQQIEFTDILVEGDSLVLVRNEKNGFSSEGIYLGVYNCVERMWTVEYQAYDEYLESSYYACLLYTSPSPRDYAASRMPSSA